MAQFVRYFENNVEFKEGPFVLCNPLGNGYRIEVELKGHNCPVLPDSSIYSFLERSGYNNDKTWDKASTENKVDFLNSKVRIGVIVNENGVWKVNSLYKNL